MSLPAKLLALLLSALAFIAAGYVAGKRLTLADWNADKAAQTLAMLKAVQAVQAEEQKNAKRMQDAQSNQLKAVIKKAADTAAVTTERNSLRDQVRDFSSSAKTIAAANQRTDTIGELFGECVKNYEGMAGKADGHALDVKMLLEAWQK